MTRVRTHHEFVQRPVWCLLGGDAFLLHHAALAYVNAHGTDGLVPRKAAKTLHPGVKSAGRRIADLLDAGLWTELGEHYRVCDVQDDLRVGGGRGDEQPSAAYVMAENERARVRKEQWKQKKNKGRNGEGNTVPNAGKNGAQVQGSAGQDRAVQDSHESSPAPKPTPADADCEHGVDLHASCQQCPPRGLRAVP